MELTGIRVLHISKVFNVKSLGEGEITAFDGQFITIAFNCGDTKRLELKTVIKNGIIKDQDIRLNACKEVYDFAISCGFIPKAITTAPIVKGKNVEYLIHLKKNSSQIVDFDKIFIK